MLVRQKVVASTVKILRPIIFARARFVYWRLITLWHQRIDGDISLFRSINQT